MRSLTTLVLGSALAAALVACPTQAPPPPPGAPTAPPGLRLEPGVDRAGNDFKDFDLDAADPAACAGACAQEANCKAFTYVKPGVQGDKARCWLKDAVPNAVPSDCCTSGVR